MDIIKNQIIVLSNYIIIKTPVQIKKELCAAFTFTNPEYTNICKRRRLPKNKYPKDYIVIKSQKNGRWTSTKIPEKLKYYRFKAGNLLLHRGALNKIQNLFKRYKIQTTILNKRKIHPQQNFKFYGVLASNKGQSAILNFKAHDGILNAPTGSGKTVMACWLIAKWQQPTLILVNTTELQNQWVTRIATFLKIKAGIIGGGKMDIKPITVALIQTLRNIPKVLKNFGFLIIDEVHVVATESYGIAINNYKGLYSLGLSATLKRNDGKTRVMHWYCGHVETTIAYEKAERTPCIVEIMLTNFESKISFRNQYSKALVALTEDPKRNALIIENILKNVEIFGVHLILSNSSKHLYRLYGALPAHIQLISKVLVGNVSKEKRQKIVSKMANNKLKFIFATQQLLGTGFDEPLLSVLHLTTPIKNQEQLKQYLGRIARIHKEKEKSYIFDYFDRNIPILRNSAKKRSELYNELKIKRI